MFGVCAILSSPYFWVLLIVAIVFIITGLYLMFVGIRLEKEQKKNEAIEKELEAKQRDEEIKRVYNWLYEQHYLNFKHWYTIIEISNGVNLTVERTKHICKTHDEFQMNTTDTECRLKQFHRFT